MTEKKAANDNDHEPLEREIVGHGTPVTRRDMLARGVLSYSAALMMPSALTMITGRAFGAEPICNPTSSGGKKIPFLIFDLAGGGNIAGTNVIVGGKGGQQDLLKAGGYVTLGLDAVGEAALATPDTTFGLAFHPQSKMLAGMKSIAVTAAAGTDGALFCASSADDTKTNPHSPLYWIARAGLSGSLVSLVGSVDGTSGGNSAAPAKSVDPTKSPVRISKPADSRGIVDPGSLARLLGSVANPDTKSVKKVMAAIRSMSESRIAAFQALDVPTQIQDLIRCGYINSSAYFSMFTPEALDPTSTLNTQVQSLYPGLATDPVQQAAGTIAHLVLGGYAGAGVVSLAGFDYHTTNRAGQDAKDLLAGQMIGRALELAALKQTPLMIYVYTDGGVTSLGGPSTNGILTFNSDSAQRSAAFALVYKPGGERPKMRNSTRQVGAYNQAGAVDEKAAIIGNNVENLSKAIAANWLALHGNEGELAKAVGDNPFLSDFEAYLPFTKIV